MAENKTYLVYREALDDKNLIGNLHLDTIRQIHGPDIYINHAKGFVIVKKDPKYAGRREDVIDPDAEYLSAEALKIKRSFMPTNNQRQYSSDALRHINIKREDREYSERRENSE
jgi:hypothetical protein